MLAGGVAATALASETAKKKIAETAEKVADLGTKLAAEGSSKAEQLGKKVGVVETKPSPGPGTYILIGLGVVAVAGLAYAVWQTLPRR